MKRIIIDKTDFLLLLPILFTENPTHFLKKILKNDFLVFLYFTCTILKINCVSHYQPNQFQSV